MSRFGLRDYSDRHRGRGDCASACEGCAPRDWGKETSIMGESMGLYDSDTGATIEAIASVEFGHTTDGSPLSVSYAVAKRGRIAQIRSGSLRFHYFIDEPAIDVDADRIGRWLEMDGKEAVRIIRERAPKSAQ